MATPREFLFPSFKTGRLRRFAQRGLPLPAPIQGRKRCKCFMAYLMNGSAFFLTRRRVSRAKTARKTRQRWPNSDCRPITFFIRRSFGATRMCASCARFYTSKKRAICACLLSSQVSIKGTNVIFRQLVQTLQLDDQVFFLGHVSRPALRALYQNALVLCYSSLRGPLNLPPLEAFELGCPEVAADIPGTKEQFGDAAILVNPADDLQIACALRSLFSDNAKREELIRRGRERAGQFTGKDFAKGLLGLLDEFEPIRRCWSPYSQDLLRS